MATPAGAWQQQIFIVAGPMRRPRAVSPSHRVLVPVDRPDSAGADNRRDGYRAAMNDHGLAAEIGVVPDVERLNRGGKAARGERALC